MSEISEKMKRASRGFCTAVVVAAGSSSRMGCDKLELRLGKMPVLAAALRALNSCLSIDEIIVVTRRDKLEETARLCRDYGITLCTKVVCGGETRTISALAGVSEADKRAKIICIHDAARPFIDPALVDEVVRAAVVYRAAAPAIPVKDTVRIAENGETVMTPERSSVFAVQTPQAFDADIIKAALTLAVQSGRTYTDDCAAVEAMGLKIRLTHGSEDNIKLTTPLDMELAAAIMRRRAGK